MTRRRRKLADHTHSQWEAMMAYIALAAFVLLVIGAGWLSSRRQKGSIGIGCCAPADPRDDLRMRAAFEDDADDEQPDRRTR